MSRPLPRSDAPMRWAMGTFKDRNRTIYTLLIIGVLLWPSIADVTTGGSGNHLVSTAADAGIYVLLAIGLNVVVGFAGLLDLGYAAFFALGAYAYGLAASFQLKIPWSVLWVPFSWLGQVNQVKFGNGDVAQLHFSYWIMLPSTRAKARGIASMPPTGCSMVGD